MYQHHRRHALQNLTFQGTIPMPGGRVQYREQDQEGLESDLGQYTASPRTSSCSLSESIYGTQKSQGHGTSLPWYLSLPHPSLTSSMKDEMSFSLLDPFNNSRFSN